MSSPILSIIIPTLNSQKTLGLTLKSIKKQHFNHNLIEILVCDGGSKDHTKKIARRYGAQIIKNTKIQPECAKYVGLLNAKGKYAMFIDSDEILCSNMAIENRIEVLEKNQNIKIVLTGGYKKPDNLSIINDYVNTFSDPFSFFMYGISSDARYYLYNLCKKYKNHLDHEKFIEFIFDKNSPIPLVDVCAGNIIDLIFLKKYFSSLLKDVSLIPKIFNLIVCKTNRFAVLKDDYILHYSSNSFGEYIKKINWRVIVNIHYKNSAGVGFSNRDSYQPISFRMKKYLFIPYALSLILPFSTSVYYSLSRKSMVNMIHFPMVIYTAFFIIYQYIIKIVSLKPKLKPYGA